jgi:hypothetical protein
MTQDGFSVSGKPRQAKPAMRLARTAGAIPGPRSGYVPCETDLSGPAEKLVQMGISQVRLVRLQRALVHTDFEDGKIRTIFSPGALSSAKSLMSCNSATAATKARPRPLPDVVRLESRR